MWQNDYPFFWFKNLSLDKETTLLSLFLALILKVK
jgi:hypothetical protein